MLAKGVNKMTVEVADIEVADKVFEPNVFETARKVMLGKHLPQIWKIFFSKTGVDPSAYLGNHLADILRIFFTSFFLS